MFLAVYTGNKEDLAEYRLALLASAAIVSYSVWLIIRKFKESPRTPDPWDDEVASAIEEEDAQPLCIHCLTPHRVEDDFCEKCGAAVGDLTNYMPPACYVSMGQVFRIGTDGTYRRSPVTIGGLLLAGLAYMPIIFFPFYCLRVLINLGRQKEPNESDETKN